MSLNYKGDEKDMLVMKKERGKGYMDKGKGEVLEWND